VNTPGFGNWCRFWKLPPVLETIPSFGNHPRFWKLVPLLETLLSGKNLKGRFLRLERLISLAGPAFLDFHPPYPSNSSGNADDFPVILFLHSFSAFSIRS
jgi:hypothetical protein